MKTVFYAISLICFSFITSCTSDKSDMESDVNRLLTVLKDSSENRKEKNEKIATLVIELNGKYPPSAPIGKDSLLKSLLEKPPLQMGEFTFSSQVGYRNKENGSWSTAIVYSTIPLNKREYTDDESNRIIEVNISVADKGTKPAWVRAVDWVDLTTGKKHSDGLVASGQLQLKTEEITDSKGQTWIKSTFTASDESSKHFWFETIVHNRYELVVTTTIDHADYPANKKYVDHAPFDQELFYKVGDIDWIMNLPQ